MIKKLFVLCMALCVSIGAYAQKKKLVKGVEAAVSRQTAKQVLPKEGFVYHPVFGYFKPMRSYPAKVLFATGEKMPIGVEDEFIQVAPVLVHPNKSLPAKAFEDAYHLTAYEPNRVRLTQAAYLWRLAHPEKSLQDNEFLFKRLKEDLRDLRNGEIFPQELGYTWYLPNRLFVKRLMDPSITPTSYAKLYELTPVYPKHITLDDYGFPVKTADADYAVLLDNYLMLSNPKQMSAFNNVLGNAAEYVPFVLTKEEHAAADKLLQLRLQGEKLPANPTPRDVLELAYNRLETHTIPYSYPYISEGYGYKAYPNYKNTQLYRTIKGMIKDQLPIESRDFYGYITLENPDITHLIVLDAVMGGVEADNLKDVSRVLYAFERLCADVNPDYDRDIAHLEVLQDNLHVVFEDLIRFADEQIDFTDLRWEKWRVANQAWSLLEAKSIYQLVGHNWKQRY